MNNNHPEGTPRPWRTFNKVCEPITMGRETHPELLLENETVEDLNHFIWGRSGRPIDKNKQELKGE